MATILTKNSFTSGVTPSGLSAGELAVNVSDKKLFVGNAVGGVVTLHDQNSVVTSVNGATGAVTNINAASVTVTNSNSSSTVYPLFAFGAGSTAIYADITTTPLSYVPSTGTVNGRIFNGTFGASNVAKIDAQVITVTLTDGTDGIAFTNSEFSRSGTAPYTFVTSSGFTFSASNGVQFTNDYSTPTWSYTFPRSNGSAGQAVVWPSSGSGLTWSNVVTSVNGATGAVANIAVTNAAQTFSGLQTFNVGLSATSGCSFNTATVYIVNSGAVDPLYVQHASTNGLKVATTGQARSGSIRLGNAATSTQNTFISQTDGTLTLYNGFSTTGGNMLSISTSAVTIPTTISGATFSGLLRSSSGISADLGICGGTYISAAGGYRVTSTAIKTLTGTTYTLLTSDDGKILTTSNASLQKFEIPTGLPVGFNCSVIQLGTGPVGFSAASGVTLNTFAGKTLMAGQYAAVSIIEYENNIVNIAGGLTA